MNDVNLTVPIFLGGSLTSGAEAKPLRPTWQSPMKSRAFTDRCLRAILGI